MSETKSYEEAINRLNEILKILESGQQSLQETLKLMAEGKELLSFCQEELQAAEKQLEVLDSEE